MQSCFTSFILQQQKQKRKKNDVKLVFKKGAKFEGYFVLNLVIKVICSMVNSVRSLLKSILFALCEETGGHKQRRVT